jgi:G protein beta subunit-like protein
LKASISADLRYLATCSADKTVKLWTLNEKNMVDKYPRWEHFSTLYGILYPYVGHGKWVWDCAFSCDSEYIITGSSDLTTKIW